jgi:hypothetical protein
MRVGELGEKRPNELRSGNLAVRPALNPKLWQHRHRLKSSFSPSLSFGSLQAGWMAGWMAAWLDKRSTQCFKAF